MTTMSMNYFRGTAALAFLAFLTVTRSTSLAGNQDAANTPATVDEVREKAVLKRLCGTCHEWERVTDMRRSKADWETVVDNMIGRGVEGTDEELDLVMSYVLRHHALVNVNTAPAEELMAVVGLTEGEAKLLVEDRTKSGRIADFAALKQRCAGIDSKKLDAAKASILY